MGFALVGIAKASEADHFDRFEEWIAKGYAGEMAYLHATPERRRHPNTILPDVQSVVMMALTYPTEITAGIGKIARYAHGPDYHQYCWEKLNSIRDWLAAEVPGSHSHGVTDSAPLLERDFARRAGLGWFGKNTMLINKRLGSFFFLAGLLTSVTLKADEPHVAGHCGSCTACIDACPTEAIIAPGTLDARRCISYLTIESKKATPLELRSKVGDWFFGCDVCQEVCPWNRHGNAIPSLPFNDEIAKIDILELFSLSGGQIRKRFEGTSLSRANWRALLRNAAIALGNLRDVNSLPALRRGALLEDEMVRETCEWAIQQIESLSR